MVAVGAPVFRQYPYEQGPFVDPGTTVALVTDDPEDAHHSPVQLAVVAGPAAGLRRPRGAPARPVRRRPRRPTGRVPPAGSRRAASRCGPRT